MKWKDLLADKTKYPDDFVVSYKDGDKTETMTLGQMRTEDADTRGELTRTLTAKEQDLQKRERDVTNASKGIASMLENLSAKTGLSYEELIEGKTPTKKTVAQSAELDENDPLVGALVKEIKGLRTELASNKEEIATVKKNALGPMLNTYLEDYYESTWEKLAPTLPKGAKVERADALKYAQDQGMKDAKGRLDLRKAVRDLTYDARVQEEAEKRVADLRKKDDDARTLAAVPRPAGTHINVKTDRSLLNAKGQTKSFDEMLGEAAADTEMWKAIQQQS
jgi:hypothetical protein